MNKYIIHIHIFLLTVFCSASPAVDPIKALFANRPWDFVEQIFVIEPHAQLNAFSSSMKRWIPALAAGTAAGYGTYKLAEHAILEQQETFKWKEFTQKVGSPIVGVIGLSAVYRVARAYTERSIDLQVLTQFIVEWEENKQYTPIELHESCDALYQLFMQEGATARYNEVAHKIAPILKRTIYQHFPNKYREQLQSLERAYFSDSIMFTVFHFEVDVARVLEVTARIVRAFFVDPDHRKNR
ncbi:MAG: hypothetical protein AB7F19_04730 [Candidatus Babeliales bacterium]